MVDQPLEDLAAMAIAGELGGRACRRDVPGATPGTHDFDVALSDERIVALEITTAAHKPWVQLVRRVSAQSSDVVPALRHTWSIRGHFGYLPLRPEGAPDVRAVRRQASLHLRSLEDAGVGGFDELFEEKPGADLAASVRSLRQLGITAARCHHDEPPPAKLILRGLSGYSGPVSPDAINYVIEAEVARNCAKLQRATADDRLPAEGQGSPIRSPRSGSASRRTRLTDST